VCATQGSCAWLLVLRRTIAAPACLSAGPVATSLESLAHILIRRRWSNFEAECLAQIVFEACSIAFFKEALHLFLLVSGWIQGVYDNTNYKSLSNGGNGRVAAAATVACSGYCCSCRGWNILKSIVWSPWIVRAVEGSLTTGAVRCQSWTEACFVGLRVVGWLVSALLRQSAWLYVRGWPVGSEAREVYLVSSYLLFCCGALDHAVDSVVIGTGLANCYW
jgi:hypothetical protein